MSMTPKAAAGRAEREAIAYVLRYGGFCKDCADENGVCPASGLPCENGEKAVKFVIKALRYGIDGGYIKSPFLPTPNGEA